MNTEQVSLNRFWLFIASIMLIEVFHTFPRGIALTVSTAAPWALPLAGGLAFLLVLPVLALLSRLPGQNVVDICLLAGGRPLAILTAVIFSLYSLIADGMVLRQICEMAITAIYPHTPQTFLTATLLGTAAIGASISPASLVWMEAAYVVPTLAAIGLVLAGNVGWGQLYHLVPMTGRGLGPTFSSVLFLTSYFGELIFLLVFAKYLCEPSRLIGATVRVMSTVTLAWTAVVVVTLMVFSLPGGLAIPFPLFEMTRLVQGGRFLERMDTIWILMWTYGSVGRLAVSLMMVSLVYQDVFRLPRHRDAILPIGVAVLAASLFPSNQEAAIWIETGITRRWGFLITLVLPLCIASVAWWRKRRKHA